MKPYAPTTLWPPSTVTVYPLGWFDPEVVVVTVRLPVGAVHVTVKLAWPVPLAGTVTDCGFASLTEQFDGTPVSCTEWLVAVSPV